ncbi:MAG: DUF2064 domain-containing protein [Bacteroidota bacterium]
MHNRQNNTALLVFSRTPREEAAVKTFDAGIGRKGNTAIARRLLRHTLETARQSQLPVFTSYSSQQRGEHFGERLANAIEELFRQGFTAVIAIGNDTPDLCTDLLRQAERQLQSHPLVLGPAKDGGLYLIGLHRSAYQRRSFIELPWESDQLQAHCQHYATAQQLARPFWLRLCADIDNPWDFHRFLNSRAINDALRQSLLPLLTNPTPRLSRKALPHRSTFLHLPIGLRAPPALF